MSRNILKKPIVLVAGVAALAGLTTAAVTSDEAARQGQSWSVIPASDATIQLADGVIVVSDDKDDTDSAGRGYLGVSVQRLRKALREAFDIPSDVRGLVVTNVHDDTPADDAGLRNQDVILQLNGRPMDDEDEFTEAIRAIEPGTTANLKVWRDGGSRDISFTAAKRPRTWSYSWNSDDEDAPRAFAVPRPPRAPRAPRPPRTPDAPMVPEFRHFGALDHFRSGGRLGVEIRDLNDDIAEYFGVSSDNGALVWKVNEESPAEKAGLKAGDVIVEVEGESIKDTDDLRQALADHEPGETVAVSYVRRGSNGTARVELGKGDAPELFFFSDGPGQGRGLRRLDGLHHGFDRTMDDLHREMERLQQELDELRRDLDRAKD